MMAMPETHGRFRRDAPDFKSIGKDKGTNIQMIRLAYRQELSDQSGNSKSASNSGPASGGKLPEEASSKRRSVEKAGISSGSVAGIVVAVLLLVIALAAVILYKRRKPAGEVKRTASNISVGDQEGTEI